MYRNRIAQLALAAGLLSVAACKDNWPTTPVGVSSAPAGRSITPTWEKTVTGTTGEGAQYSVFVPANWNGDVVYYAHGIKDVAEPIALPVTTGFPEFRDSLGVMGYAVATSSFSENGWAVQDGMQKTHQLRGIFASIAGNPRRSFIAGHSMGGLITVALAEKFPQQYDGALAMCGVLGGTKFQIDYVGHTRALFDFFYPGALPGDAAHVAPDVDVNQDILTPAIGAIGANPMNALALASITQTPLPFANGLELGESLLTALTGHAAGFNDAISRTHGHPLFDNRTTEYTGAISAPVLQAINAGVERFDAAPDALRALDQYYEPSGELSVPLLLLSTSRDPVLPAFHQIAYTNAVAANGNADLLAHRIIDRYGHCNFTPAELGAAFADIVKWVELGIKPTS